MIKLQKPQNKIAGVTLKNHMLLAAGVLGTTGSSLKRMLSIGAGGVGIDNDIAVGGGLSIGFVEGDGSRLL